MCRKFIDLFAVAPLGVKLTAIAVHIVCHLGYLVVRNPYFKHFYIKLDRNMLTFIVFVSYPLINRDIFVKWEILGRNYPNF